MVLGFPLAASAASDIITPALEYAGSSGESLECMVVPTAALRRLRSAEHEPQDLLRLLEVRALPRDGVGVEERLDDADQRVRHRVHVDR